MQTAKSSNKGVSHKVPSGDRPKGKGKGKGKTKESEGNKISNPYKLPNHSGHNWDDSFSNPRSKNFKGVACTPKDYDSNGKIKKKVKESEQNFRSEKKSKGKSNKA